MYIQFLQIRTSLLKLIYVSFRYQTHILIFMITVVYTEIPPDLFKCYKCQETFLSETDLDHHQKIEAGCLLFGVKPAAQNLKMLHTLICKTIKGFTLEIKEISAVPVGESSLWSKS